MRWALEITHTDPQRLQIVDPAFTIGVWLFGAPAVLFLLLAWFAPSWLQSLTMFTAQGSGEAAAGAGRIIGWGALLLRLALLGVAVLFAGIAWASSASWSRATFSKESGRLEVVDQSFFRSDRLSMDLNDVARVEVQSERSGRRVLVLDGAGKPLAVTRLSNRSGHQEAAQSIRDFLGLANN